MSKNLIPQITEMLGVRVNEEFKIKDKNGEFVSDKTYKFSENALMYFCQDDNICRIVSRTTLCSLLNGNYEVVRLPWKPREDGAYYTFIKKLGSPCWTIACLMWGEAPADFARLKTGWVFRTREEAKAALPKVAKEMSVEYIEE